MSDAANDKLTPLENEHNGSASLENEEEFMVNEAVRDALGEIGNICMGTSATTLSKLMGKKVSITTPRVSICHSANEIGEYQKPFVVVEVQYTEGISGYNILFLKEEDVRIITDLLMGGNGAYDPETPMDELHLSTISEVMNQMVGSASTSLADIIKVPIVISPPKVKHIHLDEDEIAGLACGNDTTIKISFAMTIEGILDSEIMQVIPCRFGKNLANMLLDDVMHKQTQNNDVQPIEQKAADLPQHSYDSQMNADLNTAHKPNMNRVGVKAIQYESFDSPAGKTASAYDAETKENISLIMDVPLQVTVELGKCKKSIKEILAFNVGSVIVLDRLAGEMVDILVNGKLFAKGEVVVIDDNYGVRVTDIIATTI